MPPAIAFADPATVELAPNPIPQRWILDGAPQARSKQLAESANGTSMIMAWSCTAGSFTWNYAGDETVHIISGEVFVTDGDGAVRRLGPGDMAFFPARSRSAGTCRTGEETRSVPPRHAHPLGTVLRAWNKFVETLVHLAFAYCVASGVRGDGARPWIYGPHIAWRPLRSGRSRNSRVIDKPAGDP